MPLDNRNSEIAYQQSYSEFLHPKYWPTWGVIASLWMLTRLPYGWQMAIGRLLGKLSYRLLKSRRHVAEVNIRLCFPEKSPAEQTKLVKDVFLSYGQGLMETAMSWCRSNRMFADKVEFHGCEHLDKALAEGNGILMIGGHFTILDLAGALMGLKYQYDIVHRHNDNPLFNLFMTRSRSGYVNYCVARKDVRGMIRSLRDGRILWYAPDQDYGRKESIFVPFMGVQTATITATSRLAKAGKAVVIPTTFVRLPDNQGYRIDYYPPLDIPTGDDAQDAIFFNQWLEQQVRKYPDQYLWLHKRFKTRPEGEPGVY